MTRDKMLELAKGYMSNENKKKIEKAINYLEKLHKKDIEYIQVRDMIVLCYIILYGASNLDSLTLNKKQRKSIKGLLDGLFKEENGEQQDFEKQRKLLELSLKLNDVWKNRHQYINSVGLIEDLEQQIKELENE